MTKKPKLYCHFKSIWRTQEFTVHLSDPQRSVTVSGEVLSGVEGGDKATCKTCGVTFSVRHGGSNDVVKHFSSKHHLQAMCSSSSTQTLDKFGFGQSEVHHSPHNLPVHPGACAVVTFLDSEEVTSTYVVVYSVWVNMHPIILCSCR